MSAIFGKLRHFDAYSKPLEDFRVKTLFGGTEIEEELFVDTSAGDDKLKIIFDVVFPALPCVFISVDAMDISGEHQTDVSHNIWKTRIDQYGKPLADEPQKLEVNKSNQTTETEATTPADKCGSCYGAENEIIKCCNTCDDVRKAYASKGWAVHDMDKIEQCKSDTWVKMLLDHKDEGCKVYGHILVAKVGGNFHIAPGKTLTEKHAHVHDLHSLGPQKFNTTHRLLHFAFGDSYPGKSFPLDGHTSVDNSGGTMFQYFVKIVPTAYVFAKDAHEVMTHQFSVTKHQKSVHGGVGDGLPGLFVMYEFSPLMVKLTEVRKSFTHFATSLCAIIGGVFTVASLIDSFIYQSSRVLQRKIELGKAS